MNINPSVSTSVRHSTCYECDANCPFEVTVDAEGRAIGVEGMPSCPRGQMQLSASIIRNACCIR
ncbi:MAG: hypothetical protein R3E95_11745 [Thiolinea sp.]